MDGGEVKQGHIWFTMVVELCVCVCVGGGGGGGNHMHNNHTQEFNLLDMVYYYNCTFKFSISKRIGQVS